MPLLPQLHARIEECHRQAEQCIKEKRLDKRDHVLSHIGGIQETIEHVLSLKYSIEQMQLEYELNPDVYNTLEQVLRLIDDKEEN